MIVRWYLIADADPRLQQDFYLLRKKDRPGEAAQKGDGEDCEWDFLTLVPRINNSNEIQSPERTKVHNQT